jgi:hypothetical protein
LYVSFEEDGEDSINPGVALCVAPLTLTFTFAFNILMPALVLELDANVGGVGVALNTDAGLASAIANDSVLLAATAAVNTNG